MFCVNIFFFSQLYLGGPLVYFKFVNLILLYIIKYIWIWNKQLILLILLNTYMKYTIIIIRNIVLNKKKLFGFGK